MFSAECSSDKECGAGGQCLSGYCGCFTTFCSELAYAALPGCERFCQCDLASGQWKLQTCNLISQELFDETINNCNHMAAIEPNLCASGTSCEIIDENYCYLLIKLYWKISYPPAAGEAVI